MGTLLIMLFVVFLIALMFMDFGGFLIAVIIIATVTMCTSVGDNLDELEEELTEYVEVHKEKLKAEANQADPNDPTAMELQRIELLREVMKMCNDHREIEYEDDGKLINIGCGMPYIRDVQ